MKTTPEPGPVWTYQSMIEFLKEGVARQEAMLALRTFEERLDLGDDLLTAGIAGCCAVLAWMDEASTN